MDKMRFIRDDFRMSRERVERGWTMPYAHYHLAHEIYILESGERIVTVNGEEYRAKAGDASLFYSNIPHRSRGETAFEGICLHFSERYLDIYFSELAKHQLMRCFRYKAVHLSGEQLDRIRYFADSFQVSAPDNFVRLAEILSILNQAVWLKASEVEAAGTQKAEKIIDYVNKNYSAIRRIKEITDGCRVSENYVFQVFREKYRMTPKTYINELRVRNVCHRLKYTQETIKQISAQSGFENYEYFARVFKNRVGMTPKQYREQCLRSGGKVL